MGTGPLMRPSHAIPCKMLIVTWLFASLIRSTMCRLNVRPPRIHIHSVTPLENRVRESLPPPSTILTHLKDRIQFFHNLLYLILYNYWSKYIVSVAYLLFLLDKDQRNTSRINEIPKLDLNGCILMIISIKQ